MLSEDRLSSPHPFLGQDRFWQRGPWGKKNSLLRGPIAIRQGKNRRTTHFARGLDALPDAEETDKPDEKKAESEVPLQRAGVVDSRRQAQHVAP